MVVVLTGGVGEQNITDERPVHTDRNVGDGEREHHRTGFMITFQEHRGEHDGGRVGQRADDLVDDGCPGPA